MVGRINKDKIYLLLSVIGMCFFGLFMYLNAGEQSFWFDELASIGFISSEKTFADFLGNYLTIEIYNLPLYQVFLYFLYRMVPFGEQYLLLLSIIFLLAGVGIMAKCAKELAGSAAGFLTVCLSLVSTWLIWQCGWELRSYSLLVLLSAAALLFYVRKERDPSNKQYLYYALSLSLLMYTHWFGVLAAAFYGCMDAVKWIIKRRLLMKEVFSYIGSVILFLPWLVLIMLNIQVQPTEFWASPPQWKDMIWVLENLLSGDRVFFIFFIIGCAVTVLYYKKYTMMLSLVLTVIWSVGSVYLYSSFINPGGSLFINRYFIVVLPHVFILTGFGLVRMLDSVKRFSNPGGKRSRYGRFLSGGAVGLLLIYFIYAGVNCYTDSYKYVRMPREPYREAAEKLAMDSDFYKEDSLLIGYADSCVLDGFIDYYFKKKGNALPPNIITGRIGNQAVTKLYHNYNEYSQQELLQFNKLYCIQIHKDIDEEFSGFIAKHYQLTAEIEELNIQIWGKRPGD